MEREEEKKLRLQRTTNARTLINVAAGGRGRVLDPRFPTVFRPVQKRAIPPRGTQD